MLQLLQVYQPVAVTLQTTLTAQAILFVAQAQPQQPEHHQPTPVLLQAAEVPTAHLLLQEVQAAALLQAAEVLTAHLLLQEAQAVVLLQAAEVLTLHPLLLQEAQAAVLQVAQEALVLPVHADNPKGFLNTKRASAIPMLFFLLAFSKSYPLLKSYYSMIVGIVLVEMSSEIRANKIGLPTMDSPIIMLRLKD